jgi:hypothetical protein
MVDQIHVPATEGHLLDTIDIKIELEDEEAALLQFLEDNCTSLLRAHVLALDLKVKRNLRASISKLPTNILARIFSTADRHDTQTACLPFSMVVSQVTRPSPPIIFGLG